MGGRMAISRKGHKDYLLYSTAGYYRLVDVQYEGLTNGVAGEL